MEKYEEIRTMMHYFFQSKNFRGEVWGSIVIKRA